MTTTLVEKLEPDEVKATIAHELAHLKLRHVRKQFVVGLICTAAIWSIWFLTRLTLFRYANDETRVLLNSTIPFMVILNGLPIMLITGFGTRKRELEADALAVQWTGDPELVIRALTKLHTLNASPHRLKPGDELVSSHPSLVNRIKAIRGGPM